MHCAYYDQLEIVVYGIFWLVRQSVHVQENVTNYIILELCFRSSVRQLSAQIQNHERFGLAVLEISLRWRLSDEHIHASRGIYCIEKLHDKKGEYIQFTWENKSRKIFPDTARLCISFSFYRISITTPYPNPPLPYQYQSKIHLYVWQTVTDWSEKVSNKRVHIRAIMYD